MLINNIKTDNDLINFLFEQYKQSGNLNFMLAADSLQLYRRDCEFLKFQLGVQNKWISIEDMLPDKDQEVLVYRGHHSGLMNVYIYMGNNEWEDDYGYWGRTDDEGITHWMPLPIPPTEKEN